MDAPHTPLDAVTHCDPYPYYDALATMTRPVYVPAVRMFVAASAASVRAVLAHPQCTVRPAAEPVPRALQDGAAGALFADLVRMRDDAARLPLRRALGDALRTLTPHDVRATAKQIARTDLSDRTDRTQEARLAALTLTLPTRVLAHLLGLGARACDEAPTFARDLARAFAPGADATDLARGHAAATHLLARIAEARLGPHGLTAQLAASAPDLSDRALLANVVGLLTQSFEATAGLIGNALVWLARRPDRAHERSPDPRGVDALLERVLREDPPVQNTRRFVRERGEIAGTLMEAGDTVLVVLAAALRDPREDHALAFGAGGHACPGAALAQAIAAGLVEAALEHQLDRAPACRTPSYRPSLNTRVPTWI